MRVAQDISFVIEYLGIDLSGKPPDFLVGHIADDYSGSEMGLERTWPIMEAMLVEAWGRYAGDLRKHIYSR